MRGSKSGAPGATACRKRKGTAGAETSGVCPRPEIPASADVTPNTGERDPDKTVGAHWYQQTTATAATTTFTIENHAASLPRLKWRRVLLYLRVHASCTFGSVVVGLDTCSALKSHSHLLASAQSGSSLGYKFSNFSVAAHHTCAVS